MKRFFKVLVPVLLVAILFVTPAFALGWAQAGDSQEPVMTAVQMYVVGVAASALVYALRLVAKRWPKIQLHRGWLTVLTYLISFGLALAFGGLTLPVFGAFEDPVSFIAAAFGWLNAFLLALGPAVGFATLIYNVLLNKVLDGIAVDTGLLPEPGPARKK